MVTVKSVTARTNIEHHHHKIAKLDAGKELGKDKDEERTLDKMKELPAKIPNHQEATRALHRGSTSESFSNELAVESAKVDACQQNLSVFQATDNRSLFEKAVDKILHGVINALNSKIRGAIFTGHTRKQKDRKLDLHFKTAKLKSETLNENLKIANAELESAHTAFKAHPSEENKNALAVAEAKQKDVQSQAAFAEKSMKELDVKIQKRDGYAKKGDEMRKTMVALGGKHVQLVAADHTRLDGMFLSASNFRAKLQNAGAEILNISSFEYTTRNGKQIVSRPIQAISLPSNVKDEEVMQALNALKAFPSVTNGVVHPGTGWSRIKDGDRLLLVRTEDMPSTDMPSNDDSHPLFRKVGEEWQMKALPEGARSQLIPIDPHAKGGTVILTSGNEGLYEMNKAEALSFLLKGMNVMMFNFRGYGLSEGTPTETGLKLDMEAAYQFVKNETGEKDNKILFKALCMSGGPAAFVAAKHPETNIFLDQTYSEFKELIREQTKALVKHHLDSLIGESDTTTLAGQLAEWSKNKIGEIVGQVAKFVVPDFNVAKNLSKNHGKKAIFYVQDDSTISDTHVLENIKAVAKAGKMEQLMVISGPGDHGESLLKIAASPASQDSRIRELEKNYRQNIEPLVRQKWKERDEIWAKADEAERQNRPQEKAEFFKRGEELNRESNVLTDAHEESIAAIAIELGPESRLSSATAQAQLNKFLNSASLSDPVIQSSITLIQSKSQSVIESYHKLMEKVSVLKVKLEPILEATITKVGSRDGLPFIEFKNKQGLHVLSLDEEEKALFENWAQDEAALRDKSTAIDLQHHFETFKAMQAITAKLETFKAGYRELESEIESSDDEYSKPPRPPSGVMTAINPEVQQEQPDKKIDYEKLMAQLDALKKKLAPLQEAKIMKLGREEDNSPYIEYKSAEGTQKIVLNDEEGGLLENWRKDLEDLRAKIQDPDFNFNDQELESLKSITEKILSFIPEPTDIESQESASPILPADVPPAEASPAPKGLDYTQFMKKLESLKNKLALLEEEKITKISALEDGRLIVEYGSQQIVVDQEEKALIASWRADEVDLRRQNSAIDPTPHENTLKSMKVITEKLFDYSPEQ